MKILQITFNLSSGGGERFVVDLSNHLCLSNDVVLVQIQSNEDINNSHYLTDLSSNIKYINLGFKSFVSLGVLRNLYKTIKSERPDVVNAHCTLLPISFAAFFYRKPKYFHTLHSMANRCLGHSYLKPLYYVLYKWFVKAITISKTCNDSYLNLYGFDNAAIIKNGRSPVLPTEVEPSVKCEVAQLKQHLDDKVFIHVGRYHPVKNQELLFKTFNRLISEGEHIILLIVGRGFEGNHVFNESHSRGIYFLGEKRNVGDYLINSDYFVLTSLNEGLPISLLEAMSVGLIPVSTPAGGVCDVIRDGENGFLSDSHSPESFYFKVKESIQRGSDICREDIIKEFQDSYSMAACSANYLKVYNE